MSQRLMTDTSEIQEARYFEKLRALTPVERLLVCQATTSRVRSMALAGIRLRHPDADEKKQKLLLAEVLYGSEGRRRLEKHFR